VGALAPAAADRYAGTLADVLRLAVPPRHARAERVARLPTEPPPSGRDRPTDEGWAAYPAGPAFLRALADGRTPRAVWTALPGEDWPARLASAAATAHGAGRGALLLVADARDLDRLDAALSRALDDYVTLSAAPGPAGRSRRV